MPLSSTRSSTSMRELPLGERSTAIAAYSGGERGSGLLLSACRACGLRCQLLEPTLDPLETSFDIARKKRARLYRSQAGVVPPPVQSDLLGFVDRAHEQAN